MTVPPSSPPAADRDPALLAVLTRGRDLGFLGPGPVEVHLRHAEAYAPFVGASTSAVDLGSGGGVPGLVLARHAGDACRWQLLDANRRRCAFLREVVQELGLGERVGVLEGRAEDFGRQALLRGQADLVVARSFGPPAAVAECAAPLLAVGGGPRPGSPPNQ